MMEQQTALVETTSYFVENWEKIAVAIGGILTALSVGIGKLRAAIWGKPIAAVKRAVGTGDGNAKQ